MNRTTASDHQNPPYSLYLALTCAHACITHLLRLVQFSTRHTSASAAGSQSPTTLVEAAPPQLLLQLQFKQAAPERVSSRHKLQQQPEAHDTSSAIIGICGRCSVEKQAQAAGDEDDMDQDMLAQPVPTEAVPSISQSPSPLSQQLDADLLLAVSHLLHSGLISVTVSVSFNF